MPVYPPRAGTAGDEWDGLGGGVVQLWDSRPKDVLLLHLVTHASDVPFLEQVGRNAAGFALGEFLLLPLSVVTRKGADMP